MEGMSPIFMLIILIGIFLVCREVMCWYWKIGEIIKLLQKNVDQTAHTNSLLTAILEEEVKN